MGVHLTSRFGERTDGGKSVCNTCNSRTFLIIAGSDWDIDREGFEESGHNPADASDHCVMVREEITGHFCPQCEKITSLSFNA
jgi:Zn finger protein HypA/HybF involved in hydrogenase expression